jgi:hypothetical protein
MLTQVDKFCLMRIWANSPFIGSEVARFSRRYFFSAAVVAYAIVSSYQWAGFPYDNLCRLDEPLTGANRTYTNVTLLNGTVLPSVTVENDEFYYFCRQNWKGFERLPFPPTPRQQGDLHWMTESQETLTRLYGYTAVIFLTGYLVFFFGAAAADYLFSWFRGVANPKGMSTIGECPKCLLMDCTKGQMQHIDFSSRSDLVGYIPQVKEGGFPFPFLACDIDKIDQVR